jgi:hypothetical protein
MIRRILTYDEGRAILSVYSVDSSPKSDEMVLSTIAWNHCGGIGDASDFVAEMT